MISLYAVTIEDYGVLEVYATDSGWARIIATRKMMDKGRQFKQIKITDVTLAEKAKVMG